MALTTLSVLTGDEIDDWEQVGEVVSLCLDSKIEPIPYTSRLGGPATIIKGVRDPTFKVELVGVAADALGLMREQMLSYDKYAFKVEVDGQRYEFDAKIVAMQDRMSEDMLRRIEIELLALGEVIVTGYGGGASKLPRFDHSWAEVLNDPALRKLFRKD